jgi:hypothetical protein
MPIGGSGYSLGRIDRREVPDFRAIAATFSSMSRRYLQPVPTSSGLTWVLWLTQETFLTAVLISFGT